MQIPDRIAGANIYDNGDKLIGIKADVTLPNFEVKGDALSGPGILGEINTSAPGQFGSMNIQITFTTITEKMAAMAATKGFRTLTIRADVQMLDTTKGAIHMPLKITCTGMPAGINLGKVTRGAPMDSVFTMEITSIKVFSNGKSLLELDKLNEVYTIEGIDQLAEIRANT